MKRRIALLLSAALLALSGPMSTAPASARELPPAGSFEPRQGYYKIAYDNTWVYANRNYTGHLWTVHREHLVYMYCWDSEYNTDRVYVSGHGQGWIVRHNIRGEPTTPHC